VNGKIRSSVGLLLILMVIS